MPAKSLELKHIIKLIRELDNEIDEIEAEIKIIMDEINFQILSIPDINYRMGTMIIAEIGDFSRFDLPDKILAYAGMSPSTCQSGQLNNCYSHIEKRGSHYLRYALYNATKYVCHWAENFGAYLTKKLVRLIYQLEKSGQQYIKSTNSFYKYLLFEYSCGSKSKIRKFGNQSSGTRKSPLLCLTTYTFLWRY